MPQLPQCRPAWLARRLMAAALSLAAAGAAAQTLSSPSGMPDSVVSRLVAWRAQSGQPVALATLTGFSWDSFTVTTAPAGDSMADCGHAGLLPCGPELQRDPGERVQVLLFKRGAERVYQERIMTPSGEFAEPLPADVPRTAATLVSCPGTDGHPLWCVQAVSAGR